MSLTIGKTLAISNDASIEELLEAIMAGHTLDYTLVDYVDHEGNVLPNGKVIKFNRPFTRERILEIAVLLHKEQPNSRVNFRCVKEVTTGLHYRKSVTYKDFYANDEYHLMMITQQVLDSLLNVTINPLTLLDWSPRRYNQHEVDLWIKPHHPLGELSGYLRDHLKHHLRQTYYRADAVIANYIKDEGVMMVDIIGQAFEDKNDKVRRVYLFFMNGYKGGYTPDDKKPFFDRLVEWDHVKNSKHGKLKLEDIQIFDNLPLFAKQFPYSESKAKEMSKRHGGKKPFNKRPQTPRDKA